LIAAARSSAPPPAADDALQSGAMPWSCASWLRAAGTTAVVLVAGWGAFVAGQPPTADEPPSTPAPVSASAQRLYHEARPRLLQVRTLLKGQDSQASVGSGFLVTDEGHILTNYHVVSEAALQPDRYRLVYSTADRREGALQLLGFDASRSIRRRSPATAGSASARAISRWRRASASTRSATRSTSGSRSSKAPTTGSSSAASIPPSSSPARSIPASAAARRSTARAP
jgi:hypothetical protein